MTMALLILVIGLALITVAFAGFGLFGYNALYLGLAAFGMIAVGLVILIASLRARS